MNSALPVLSLMLITVLVFFTNLGIAQPHGHKHQHFHTLAAREGLAPLTTSSSAAKSGSTFTATATPCSGNICAKATHVAASIDCAAANGTSYTEVPGMDNYTIICNIDFPAQNIYPFILAGSFEDCLLQCEKVNQGKDAHCAGFVFAPERVGDSDDCYLKSALGGPEAATLSLIGATLSTSMALPTSTSSTSKPPMNAASKEHTAATTSAAAKSVHQTQYRAPKIGSSQLLGPSMDSPTDQYVQHALAVPENLASNLLVPGINTNLITQYPLASDTGSWTSTSSPITSTLANMSGLPHLSRDGGKGGCINGTHIFIFCDTATFQDGNMNGFVSSSVAVDMSRNGLDGKAVVLVDQTGEWQDNVGRMRGFAPMTTAEEAFNIQLSGQGYRYALWPESSPIMLNETHALLYASLVYDEVDMSTQAANFTTLGNTLLVVSVDHVYGPGAQRIVNQLFQEDEVAWGSLGGVRSWGQSGIGGMDGMIYLFGQVDNGILVARTNPFGITDRSTYSYWDGNAWSAAMLPADATSYLLDQPVMDLDVFYSPYHGTFIMVYLTPDADNTFYFRYLESKKAIIPPYAGGTGDYVENILKNQWSSEQVLYKAAAPPMAYIYSGGVHAGYFGDNDITNGGTNMLISWTEHTGQDAASPATGYSLMTAVVTLQ
jgi:hypothetical protein